MQIVENWADISGRVVEITSHPDLPGFEKLKIQVDRIGPVDKYPNLFQGSDGQILEVGIPSAKVHELHIEKERRIQMRVRRGGPNANFAHPDRVNVIQ